MRKCSNFNLFPKEENLLFKQLLKRKMQDFFSGLVAMEGKAKGNRLMEKPFQLPPLLLKGNGISGIQKFLAILQQQLIINCIDCGIILIVVAAAD